MIKNSDMKANRYANWAKWRKLYFAIIAQLDKGNDVISSTAWKHTKITPEHKEFIKATPTGLYIKHGKKWINHSHCKFTVWEK